MQESRGGRIPPPLRLSASLGSGRHAFTQLRRGALRSKTLRQDRRGERPQHSAAARRGGVVVVVTVAAAADVSSRPYMTTAVGLHRIVFGTA